MKQGREYSVYLEDILDAVQKTMDFIGEMSFDQFARDDKTIFAVIRALEIIGEASKNIPEQIKKDNTEIPWREMAGIRDKLIHDYFGIDLDVIWKTVKEDLPPLAPIITHILGLESS
ncbi:MAG: DUF86 domain-containing protein [Proteobacteria bacterium]|nr:DUF86 domain-containing protein [Pseudomonadota bacterium]MBU4470580.1 DUF86 domain-containing protein [Pseudomonadota bacterium]MCG2751415.1 DUF86 domain-containing protein [Desulfobacteraceae bacterium]